MITMRSRTMKTPMPEGQAPVKPFDRPHLTEKQMDPQEKLNKALITAATRGILGEVKELIKKGADPNHRNRVGMSALDYAKAYDYYRVAEFLENKTGK